MTNITESITHIFSSQKKYYNTGSTKSISFRIDQLKKLKLAILKNETDLYDALWHDLHKSKEETFLTEISIVLNEIDYHIRNLKKWSKPKRVSTPKHLLPSSSRVIYEPLGVTLIIAPWNYPFQLIFNPLVGAISAGNCAVLKPSPHTEKTVMVMDKIVKDAFDTKYVHLIQGEGEVVNVLLNQSFDIIFFTGSPSFGKVVMGAAAKNLTPVILELGGKSPVIVDKDANLKVAAKRIIWGKTINAGQTCIAPDYLLVHRSIKNELVNHIKSSLQELFGDDIKSSNNYARIVSDNRFDKLIDYLTDGDCIIGGNIDKSERYISPTVLDNVSLDSDVMNEEIFGPILPIITFDNIEEAINHINNNEKPLALYYFGNSSKANDIINRCTSGGACINDTIIHVANHNLPFGGVGNSGMGKYHGKYSFTVFSNQRSIMKSPTWIDVAFRYPPYRMFGFVKKLLS